MDLFFHWGFTPNPKGFFRYKPKRMRKFIDCINYYIFVFVKYQNLIASAIFSYIENRPNIQSEQESICMSPLPMA